VLPSSSRMKVRIKAILATLCCISAMHALEVSRPFASHMVLPHDVEIPLHGKARAGAMISVRFDDTLLTTTSQSDGSWRVTLPAIPPSASARSLKIASGDQKIVLEDVLVGEVWLCSGQSNMDFPLQRATGGKVEGKRPENPTIRFFSLTGLATSPQPFRESDHERLKPENFFQGNWQKDGSPLRGNLSAVAWWFAQQRQLDTNMPIGIVENAVGGSGTEAWLSQQVLQSRAEYADFLTTKWLDHPKVSAWAKQRARQQTSQWKNFPHPFQPGFLYQSGIAWWRDFPFTAAIWYQGETNAEMADIEWNSRLLEDLMSGWREGLRHPTLPFFIVELPRIGGNDPLRQYWPQYRKAQQKAVANTPHAYRIVTMDLGWDSPDVHPPDKKPLALRVAAEVKRQLRR
jgi:sialate O-acetylesterase